MDLLDVMKNLSIRQSDDSMSKQVMKTSAADINNVATEIVFGNYNDRYLVIISQYEKVGSMLMVEKDQVHSPLGTNDIYTIKVIFGDTGDEQQVAARFLAEGINITKPMCIFINLKSYDIDTVKACKEILLELKNED